jgi:signal peptidase I
MITGLIKFIINAIKCVLFVLVLIGIYMFVLGVKENKYTYMSPTLEKDDWILIDKLSYRFNDIKRGDVVTFFYKNPSYLIGRVVGLPGEKIEFKDGKLYVNDEHIDEFYLKKENTEDYIIEKIPENMYFILSDNRLHSFDSRDESVGLIEKEDIFGKAVVRIWPLNKIGIIKNY